MSGDIESAECILKKRAEEAAAAKAAHTDESEIFADMQSNSEDEDEDV